MNCKWEWHPWMMHHNYGHFLMFNSDMSLWFDIDNHLNRFTGEVSCNWKTCPINHMTEDITLNYARNNQLWYLSIFMIMLNL